jgi:F0F1-type ATP synthase delta subunit
VQNSLKIKAIADKYGQALYEMAAAEKKLSAVSLAVDTLRQALETSPEFQRFIANKSLSNLLKQQGIIANQAQQNREEALGAVDAAEMGEMQRRQEILENRDFASNEAKLGRDF